MTEYQFTISKIIKQDIRFFAETKDDAKVFMDTYLTEIGFDDTEEFYCEPDYTERLYEAKEEFFEEGIELNEKQSRKFMES